MSIRGPEALATLDDALRDIRREEEEILRKLVRGLERASKFREAKAELLQQIAAARLKDEAGIEAAGAVTRAALASRQGLADRGIELSRNAEKLRAMERKFSEFNGARAAALAEIDRQLAGLRPLASKVGAAVGRTPEYEVARLKAARLKAMGANARLKVRQADLDREQKGRVFREDPLFSYLDRRGYGTPSYIGGGLTAVLDRWVAGLIDFEAAQANYALLNGLPGRLHRHADALADEAVRAEEQLDVLERRAVDMAGGASQREALEASRAQLQIIDDGLAALEDERDGLVAAQTVLADDRDAAFDRAVAGLVTALGSPDLASLTGGLKLRGGAEMAALAIQLDEARLRIAEEQADSRELHERLSVLADRRRALVEIETVLKARRFDDPRATFRDDSLATSELDAFLTGALPAAAYLAAWQKAQGWIPGTSDWGGGIGLPHHGRETAGAPRASESGANVERRAEARAGA